MVYKSIEKASTEQSPINSLTNSLNIKKRRRQSDRGVYDGTDESENSTINKNLPTSKEPRTFQVKNSNVSAS